MMSLRNLIKASALIIGIVVVFAHQNILYGQGIGDRNRSSDSNGGIYLVQGRVLLPNGDPAIDATVNVSSADALGRSTRTDQDGKFAFNGVSAGNYTFSVKVDSYPAESEFMTIDRDTPAGRTFTVVINLRTDKNQPKRQSVQNPMLNGISDKAQKFFHEAIEKGKDSPESGISLLDKAINEQANFPLAFYEKGSMYIRLNKLDEALASFVKAIELKSDFIEAKYSVGYTQYLKQNYEVAAAVFQDLLTQKLDRPEIHQYYGISLFKLKQLAPAEEQLKLAIAGNDQTKVALSHRFLAAIYQSKKMDKEAAGELEKYLELTPKAPDADRLRQIIADLKKSS